MTTFEWPICPFPKMQYPMADFEHENRAEEDRCLDQARKTIKLRRDTNREVAAIIIEPISSYNNTMATPYFYR